MNIRYKLSKANSTTFFFKKTSKVLVFDVKDVILGRFASYLVNVLKGKHLSRYTPNGFCSDSVYILNADKIIVSGDKYNSKIYYKHTGFPGGFKDKTFKDIIQTNNSERIILSAVKRMLNRGPLFSKLVKSIKFVKDDSNISIPGNAIFVDFKSFNKKNVLSN